jgi:hypothetical protein
LSAQYPSFSFLHEHGLGVLAVGQDLPVEIRGLVELRGEAVDRVRKLFQQLGKRVRLQMELDSTLLQREELRRSLEHEQRLRIGLEAEVAHLRGKEHEFLELQSSLSWPLIHRFHDLGARVASSGSKRRQILMRTAGIGSDSGIRQVLPQVEPEDRRNRA